MRRRTIGREFFSAIAAVLLLGLMLMGGIQTALACAYFSRERQTALTAILDGATMLSNRLAAQGSIITQTIDNDELLANAREGLEMFNTASGAVVFVADRAGTVLLHTAGEEINSVPVPAELLAVMDSGADVFQTGNLNGVLQHNYYIVGRRIELNGVAGYLFVTSPVDALGDYLQDMLAMFLLSSSVILLLCGVFSFVLTRRVTGPIEEISTAARRLGNGDFTARAPVTGCEELADFATTFNNMAARLQTIDNSRGQFMGNIAHELRTPMTTIKGFIDGMLDGTIPPEESQRYLAIVSQETGRLARLVQNMLDITKLEAGEVPIKAKSYDLWQTVTDVVLADEKRIVDGRIDIEGLGGPPLTVYADPDFVHQVVYNLVDNAIKFTPAGGVIRFRGERKADMVEVCIENTGAGIAPEALPFVFERFYKEDRSRGVNTRGSGLGLHICKVLIGLSGGQIHAESEEGQWCRFIFTLPAENKG
ncbi:MAG: ATP-binding protein [Gemmiger sp.]